ncbi:hypothetical protein NQZ68_007383 [Dissostichus eleginoides]|nr:hypothetical protein NQZ68_007383 [Dissostichus eleginoides]
MEDPTLTPSSSKALQQVLVPSKEAPILGKDTDLRALRGIQWGCRTERLALWAACSTDNRCQVMVSRVPGATASRVRLTTLSTAPPPTLPNNNNSSSLRTQASLRASLELRTLNRDTHRSPLDNTDNQEPLTNNPKVPMALLKVNLPTTSPPKLSLDSQTTFLLHRLNRDQDPKVNRVHKVNLAINSLLEQGNPHSKAHSRAPNNNNNNSPHNNNNNQEEHRLKPSNLQVTGNRGNRRNRGNIPLIPRLPLFNSHHNNNNSLHIRGSPLLHRLARFTAKWLLTGTKSWELSQDSFSSQSSAPPSNQPMASNKSSQEDSMQGRPSSLPRQYRIRCRKHPPSQTPAAANTRRRKHPPPQTPAAANTRRRKHPPPPQTPAAANTRRRKHPPPQTPAAANTRRRKQPPLRGSGGSGGSGAAAL